MAVLNAEMKKFLEGVKDQSFDNFTPSWNHNLRKKNAEVLEYVKKCVDATPKDKSTTEIINYFLYDIYNAIKERTKYD